MLTLILERLMKKKTHGMGSNTAILPYQTISRPIPRKKLNLRDVAEAASTTVEAYYQDKFMLNGIKFEVQSMQIYDETERLKQICCGKWHGFFQNRDRVRQVLCMFCNRNEIILVSRTFFFCP